MEEPALPAVEERRRGRAPLRSPHAHGGGGGGDREPRGPERDPGAEETGLRGRGGGGGREERGGSDGGRGSAGSGARRESRSRGGGGGGGGDGHGFARDRLGGRRRRLWRLPSSLLGRLLVLRVCGLVLCLVSFSVMVADKNQGWALDSFYRYREFRYIVAVNVIGFVYSGLQACDVSYLSATGKRIAGFHLRHHLDFFLDQVMSYLLLSASSSAATRVDDWELNWGEDKFPQMATASVALSILAFMAFALCSIISGYTLCTLRSS